MRLLSKTLLTAVVLAGTPMLAQAESTFVSGAGNATANLDFQVVVPRILFLRVGAGGPNFTSNPAIDLISFNVPGASLGNGTSVVATAASGDLGNGAVTARVRGNGGSVTLTSTALGALSNGAGSTISFGQINTAVTALAGAPGTPMPHPTLVDTGNGSVALVATAGVVDRGATWTYSYANSNVVAAGSYGGVGVNNGRVTYTAANP